MTNIKDFLDENDLSATDVIDALDIDASQFADVPDEPTDFYDGEPDVETLADDFDAVDLLVDEKQNLEEEVAQLEDKLQESQRPIFEDKAEQLAEMTEKWGDADDIVERFDPHGDEEEGWTLDTIEDKIELVEDIKGEQTTTVNDSTDTDNDDGGEQDFVANFADESSDTDIETIGRGQYDLRDKR